MSKIVATAEPQHRIRIRDDYDRGEILLVRGGKHRTYLWAGRDEGSCVVISGEKVLRRLVKEILAELAVEA
jgi:hypothetical protein